MKQAKRNPFLKRQHQRFTLWLDIPSQAAGLPEQADFYRWAWQTLKSDYRHAQIGIMLCDEAKARALNRDYRGKDYATNVLSFPYDSEPVICGDLVICAPVVEREAREQGKALDAHYAHLVVHGVLHLQGYDHETGDADAELMENKEAALLDYLNEKRQR